MPPTGEDRAGREEQLGEQERSPRIENLQWGEVTLEGGARFKDAKLFPGGAREWDWNETGTAHDPGIQPADLEELLERGARVVVLSRGQQERLGVPEETLDWLRERDVESHVLETRAAVERYNELREQGPVGALIHSTC